MAALPDLRLPAAFEEGRPAVIGGGLPTVDVVICAYDMRRWAWLREAVDSVLTQTYPAQNCLVVIDHNDELFAKAEMDLQHPRVTILASGSSPGLAGARNTGMQASKAEVVAFLDDDARADQNWLELLLGPYRRTEVIGTGGRIKAHWQAGKPYWFPAEYGWVVGCEYPGLPETEAPIRNAIGANMSFRREELIEVGGFNSAMGRTSKRSLGCEETELSIRIRTRTGGQIVYTPGASVTHRVARERGRLRYFLGRCYNEGISKAVVVGLVGANEGLASERAYVRKTLTRALRRCVRSGARGKWAPFGEGMAIVGGCLVTCFGYCLGRTAGTIRG